MKASDLDVLILCGGLGTRLGKLTREIPKPMLLIDRRPFLDILIDQARQAGFERFILCAGHRASIIRDYYKEQFIHYVRVSVEEVPLGTAGAIKNAEAMIHCPTFLVMNGDSYCPLNFAAFFKFHEAQEGLVTVACTKPESNRADTGFVKIAANQEVLGFGEKQLTVNAAVNTGIYFFERDLLMKIPAGKPCSLEKDIFPALKPNDFHAFKTEAPVYDIGTPERLEHFRNLYAKT